MPDKLKQPKYPIDLGKKMSDLQGGPMPVGKEMPDTIYPSLYLEWEKPYGFPDEGTMTVRFKKRSEENRKKPGDKMMQRVELDITEILDTEATKGQEDKDEESTGERLDKEIKKVERKKKKSLPLDADTQDDEGGSGISSQY